MLFVTVAIDQFASKSNNPKSKASGRCPILACSEFSLKLSLPADHLRRTNSHGDYVLALLGQPDRSRRHLEACQFTLGITLGVWFRRLQSEAVSTNPRLGKEVLVAVAMEDQSCSFLRPAAHRRHLHYGAGAAIFASEQQYYAVRGSVDLCNRVFASRQSLAAHLELERNVGNQLGATTDLPLGRRGQRTNENDHRDHCVSLSFHGCFLLLLLDGRLKLTGCLDWWRLWTNCFTTFFLTLDNARAGADFPHAQTKLVVEFRLVNSQILFRRLIRLLRVEATATNIARKDWMNPPEGLTQLLRDWSNGDQKALDKLMPLVYSELRRLAGNYLRRERQGHTLQPTALVHEAYLKLTDQRNTKWQNRAQFYGIAAQLMRRILVDHARGHQAAKRGGADQQRLSITSAVQLGEKPETDILALHEALEELSIIDPQQSRIVELKFFGGLSIEETAEVLGVGHATVERDWKMARAWLRRKLE